jgi:dienelactone hydrolase
MKRKATILPVLSAMFSFTFFSIHTNAQNENNNAINKMPTKFEAQYNPDQYAMNLYHSAGKEFDFKGVNKSDFNKWHKALLPRLRQALGLDKIESQLPNYIPKTERKAIEQRENFTLERWIIWTEPGIPLPLVVLIPKNKTGKLPLIIATHGHGKNADLYDGIYPKVVETETAEQTEISIAVQAVSQGYIAIAPTMRAFGSTRTEFDKNNNNSFSCHNQLMHDILVGRTPIGDRIWDMSKVLDWALQQFPVDVNKVAITGNSGGGTVSLFTAACDPRINVAAPSSYFCTFEGSIGSIPHCDCNYIPGILNLGEMSNIAGLIAPRPLCVINGKEDTIFPIEETRKAFTHLKTIYAAAGVPDDVTLYEGNEGHKYYKEGSWPFINKYFARTN